MAIVVPDDIQRLLAIRSERRWHMALRWRFSQSAARAAAAEAMRRILVERARQKQSLKRGGDRYRVELDDADPLVLPIACDDILRLEEALQKLEQKDARKAELVRLRFFAGLTTVQAAQALGVSATTAENDWTYARSWLRLEMAGGKSPEIS